MWAYMEQFYAKNYLEKDSTLLLYEVPRMRPSYARRFLRHGHRPSSILLPQVRYALYITLYETTMRDKILLIIILTLLIIAQTYEYIELKELEARTIQTHN